MGVWAGFARPNTHTFTLNCVTSKWIGSFGSRKVEKIQQVLIDCLSLFVLEPVRGVSEVHQLAIIAKSHTGLGHFAAQGYILHTPQ